MPRKPRVHFKGAMYHVITRGNNKSYIFSEEKDKKEYLEIIERYKGKYDFSIYSYCIIDNHAHMLIEVNDIPLSKKEKKGQASQVHKTEKKEYNIGKY